MYMYLAETFYYPSAHAQQGYSSLSVCVSVTVLTVLTRRFC